MERVWREIVKRGKPEVSKVVKKEEDRIQRRLRRNTCKMLLLLLLLGTVVSRCLHDETQKSVTLLRPHLSQLAPNFHSSSLTLPGSRDPQPLRIRICYIRDPASGAWDPEGAEIRGGPQALALAAARQATQQLQGVLAGDWRLEGGREG